MILPHTYPFMTSSYSRQQGDQDYDQQSGSRQQRSMGDSSSQSRSGSSSQQRSLGQRGSIGQQQHGHGDEGSQLLRDLHRAVGQTVMGKAVAAYALHREGFRKLNYHIANGQEDVQDLKDAIQSLEDECQQVDQVEQTMCQDCPQETQDLVDDTRCKLDLIKCVLEEDLDCLQTWTNQLMEHRQRLEQSHRDLLKFFDKFVRKNKTEAIAQKVRKEFGGSSSSGGGMRRQDYDQDTQQRSSRGGGGRDQDYEQRRGGGSDYGRGSGMSSGRDRGF
jgi:hypothetical protein